MNFGTQIVKISLYRNFDGSKLVRPHFAAILVFKMAATRDLDSAIFHKGRQLESSLQADFFMKEP